MKKHDTGIVLKSLALLLFFLTAAASAGTGHTGTVDKSYHHLTVLADTHLPGAYLKEKIRSYRPSIHGMTWIW